jgi:hypothetical protein
MIAWTKAVLCAAFLIPQAGIAAEPVSVPTEQLSSLEKQSWEAVRKKEFAQFESFLADDFFDVFPNGKIVGKRELMDHYIRGVDLKEYTLSDFHVVPLSKESAILVYTAVMRGVENEQAARDVKPGQLVEARVTVTSAWALRNGEWLSVFYRENEIK